MKKLSKQVVCVVSTSLLIVGSVQAEIPAAATEMSPDHFPANPKPGECYSRVYMPPKFKEETKQVLKKAASNKIQIIPAKYEEVEEKVLVKEASEKLVPVPAEYEWREEKVLIEPATFKLVNKPATFKTITEKVIDTPAHTVWKQGRGPIEKVNNAGEIMCLVEVPAVYKTISRKVIDQPAGVEKVEVPAKYETVKKQVLVKKASYQKIEIPAEFKTVKVKKLIKPEEHQKIEIPAKYETVSLRTKLSEGRMDWLPILCETNMTRDVVLSLQDALNKAGYDIGQPDGQLGPMTVKALNRYQKDKGLAVGSLTLESLEALGVGLG